MREKDFGGLGSILCRGVDFLSFDLKEYKGKKVHLIGIGGSMMSGIAGILLNNDVRVTGSDNHESKELQHVRSMGAEVRTGGHHADSITDQDLVIYSAAIKEDNPEIQKAREKGIPTLTRSQFLGKLLKSFRLSAGIAGTHGKTSTTSLLTSITMEAGLDPTVLIGAHVPLIDSNYRVGSSEVMIVESCEYQRSFLDFPPHIAVILNVEEDHIDTYKDLGEIKEAFASYVGMVPEDGFVIANADDPAVMASVKDAKARILTFGIEAGDIRADHIVMDNNGRAAFDVVEDGVNLFHVHLPIAGTFNVYNALAAAAAALALGVEPAAIGQGLLGYKGVDRRLQELGTVNGIRYIEDYGHHPTEIRVTIETVLHFDYKKLLIVVQPLTYTRLHRFFDDFVPLFDEADLLITLPVFASREKDTGLISSEELGNAVEKRGTVPVINAATLDEGRDLVVKHAAPGDLVLFIGGGEAHLIYDLLSQQ